MGLASRCDCDLNSACGDQDSRPIRAYSVLDELRHPHLILVLGLGQ